MSHPLVTLLREQGVFSDSWGKEFTIVRGAVDPADYISSSFIREKLETSMLRWPYFSVLRRGEVPQVSSYTKSRDVIGHMRDGFPDPVAIERLMAVGGTLKLNKLTDWHRPTRTIARAIEEIAPVAVSTYVFWTPAESRGMLPHRDASHVVVVQLEGRKDWNLYAQSGQVRSGAGLDVDSTEPSDTFTLEPGDVLYLPHGVPHDAIARDGQSLHLTFTLAEPTPEDLLEALRLHMERSEWELSHRYHARTLPQRSADVKEALLRAAAGYDADAWTQLALSMTREKNG